MGEKVAEMKEEVLVTHETVAEFENDYDFTEDFGLFRRFTFFVDGDGDDDGLSERDSFLAKEIMFHGGRIEKKLENGKISHVLIDRESISEDRILALRALRRGTKPQGAKNNSGGDKEGQRKFRLVTNQ